MFTSDQLYILMATENAGIALEDYEVCIQPISTYSSHWCHMPSLFADFVQFSSVEGVVSVVSQVAGALAVGEAVSHTSQ